MKRYYIAAAIVAVINITIYPFMKQLAYLERGYNAYGGEEMLFAFGFIAVFMVLDHGWKKTRRFTEEVKGYNAYPKCGTHLNQIEHCNAKKDSLPESKPSYTESEQSENHFDALLIYHRQNKPVNEKPEGERV